VTSIIYFMVRVKFDIFNIIYMVVLFKILIDVIIYLNNIVSCILLNATKQNFMCKIDSLNFTLMIP
jgi:hypothetical protein